MKKIELNTSRLQLKKEKVTDLVKLKTQKENDVTCSVINTTTSQPFTHCKCQD
jgi:hypothetical protein